MMLFVLVEDMIMVVGICCVVFEVTVCGGFVVVCGVGVRVCCEQVQV